MSTKIYYAYRLKKSRVPNLMELMWEWKQISLDHLRKFNSLGLILHVECAFNSAKRYNIIDEEEYSLLRKKGVKGVIREHNFLTYYVIRAIDSLVSITHCDLINFDLSIFEDKKYYYIKFFPNIRLHYDIIRVIEKKYHLKDFHYQNQTDRPEKISSKEWNMWREKWNYFTESFKYSTYENGLIFNLLQGKDLLIDDFLFKSLKIAKNDKH